MMALLLVPSIGNASLLDMGYKFYTGVDGHYRSLNMPTEFGGNVFSKHYPGMNAFFGARVNDYLGVEVGYHTTNNKNSHVVVKDHDKVLGVYVHGGAQHHLSSGSMNGHYVILNGYYPIGKINNNPLEAILYVGLARNKIQYKNVLIMANSAPQNINSSILIFNAVKPLIKAGVGFQYDYCHCVIRFTFNYENLNRFNKVRSQNNNKDYMMKIKDSFHFGVGILTYIN